MVAFLLPHSVYVRQSAVTLASAAETAATRKIGTICKLWWLKNKLV